MAGPSNCDPLALFATGALERGALAFDGDVNLDRGIWPLTLLLPDKLVVDRTCLRRAEAHLEQLAHVAQPKAMSASRIVPVDERACPFRRATGNHHSNSLTQYILSSLSAGPTAERESPAAPAPALPGPPAPSP